MEIFDKIYDYIIYAKLDNLYERRYYFIKDLLNFNELGTMVYYDNISDNYYFYNKLFSTLDTKYLIFFVSLYTDNIMLLPLPIINLCIFKNINIDILQSYFINILENNRDRIDIYKLIENKEDLPEFWKLYSLLEDNYEENYDFVYETDYDVINKFELFNNIQASLNAENMEFSQQELIEDNYELNIEEFVFVEKQEIETDLDVLSYMIYSSNSNELTNIFKYFGEDIVYKLISNPNTSDYSLFMYDYFFIKN